MGILITIVGNVASGKTTLTRKLAEHSDYIAYFEKHEDMLYQKLFADNPQRYGLPNQIDYFLFRADQERMIRASSHTGITDGGLDLDYYLFAQLFYHKGYLDATEFELCKRLHTMLRAALPTPDLIVYLKAPLDLLEDRWRQRARQIDAEISTIADLPILQRYLTEFLELIDPQSLITLDATQDMQREETITFLQEEFQSRLSPNG